VNTGKAEDPADSNIKFQRAGHV